MSCTCAGIRCATLILLAEAASCLISCYGHGTTLLRSLEMLSAVSLPFLVWLWLRAALFETGAFTHSYLTFFKKEKKKKKGKTQLFFFSIFSSPCPHFLTFTTCRP